MADQLYNASKQGILSLPKGQNKDLADALVQALQRHSMQGVRVMANQEDDILDEVGF